jgi:hypothetical protein
MAPHPLWYEAERVRDHVAPGFEEAARCGLVPVISHELLVGHPVAGGCGSTEIAQRLKELWPNARILIVIREQRSMLLSLYSEYVKQNGPLTLEEYLNAPGADRQPVFDFRYLEFHRLIEYYRGLFGAGAVLTLPYERFAADPVGYCNTILEFAGCRPVATVAEKRVRASLGGATIIARSIANRLFSRDPNNCVAPFSFMRLGRFIDRVDPYLPASLQRRCQSRLTRSIEKEVADRYIESNRRTGQLVGIDLARDGYVCESNGACR